jgi:hypothetical protein
MNLLPLIREQYQDCLNILLSEPDPELRAYYEGRRDVLSELLVSLQAMKPAPVSV